MTPEEFAVNLELRLRDAAQRAAVVIGAEPVLLAMAGALCNFGAANGMSAADIAATLHRFAEPVEDHAAAIAARRPSH
jgi:hypothetical protein